MGDDSLKGLTLVFVALVFSAVLPPTVEGYVVHGLTDSSQNINFATIHTTGGFGYSSTGGQVDNCSLQLHWDYAKTNLTLIDPWVDVRNFNDTHYPQNDHADGICVGTGMSVYQDGTYGAIFIVELAIGRLTYEYWYQTDGTFDFSYTPIQTLIDNANSGDTIVIPEGTYIEDLTLNKPITLKGENKESTIIEGDITINVDNVILSEIQIQNGKVNVEKTDDIISNVTIQDISTENVDLRFVNLRNSRILGSTFYKSFSGTLLLIEGD